MQVVVLAVVIIMRVVVASHCGYCCGGVHMQWCWLTIVIVIVMRW